MNWWRAHHGLPFDSKLAVVAKRVGARRGEVLAVWIACLDYASQREDRGSVDGLDTEEISVSLDFELSMVTAIVDGFRERGMVSRHVTPCDAIMTDDLTQFKAATERITAWDRRQVLREREDSSADRTRRYRERLNSKKFREQASPSHHVTPCDAPEQSREEQSRKEHNTGTHDGAGAPLVLVPPDVPQKPRPKRKPYGEVLEEVAKAIHGRHPNAYGRRDLGVEGVTKKLGAILNHRRIAPSAAEAYLRQIDHNHDAATASEQWRKNGGEFAKSLSGWLSPRDGRYDVVAEPAAAPYAPPPTMKTISQLKDERERRRLEGGFADVQSA
jgi:hypothetical protein